MSMIDASPEDIMAMMMGETDDVPDAPEFERMDEEEFCGIIAGASEISRRYSETGDIYEDRILSLAYYNGEVPDLAVNEGRSRMVSNDLRAVISKVQPAVMRTFFSSPQVVDYTSDVDDDAEFVETIRDGVNDQFIRHGGYVAAEAAIYDCLVHDEGVIRYEIDEQTRKITFEAIPPENLMITPDARSEQDATLIGSWSRVTRSKLIEAGYDPAKVQAASEATQMGSAEDIQRYITDQDIMLGEQSEEVDCYELFVRIDYDGDGISELRRIVFIDRCEPETLLLNEPVARARVFIVRSENRPHSARGRGLYRDVLDIMRAKTALLRAAMDNIAAVNDPTTFVDLTMVENPDDMLARKRGAIIMVNGMPAGGIMQTIQIPFTAQNCFEAMKYYDAMLADRTGVSGAASGMLPDVLAGQTATAVNMIQAGGTARVELICRNIAECSFRPMFEAIFMDIVEMTGMQVNLKDTSINVGLGSGTRERDMASLSNVMAIQEKLIAAFGPPERNPHVDHKNLSNTLNKLVEVAGLRTKDAYFKTPTDEEIQQRAANAANAPNPEKDKIEAHMALEDKKMAVQRDKETAQAQADVLVKQAEAEKEERRAIMDRETKGIDIEARVLIEREKIESAERIAAAKMQHDMMMARIAKGEISGENDPETGDPKPTQSEMMMQMIADMAIQMNGLMQIMAAPKQVTTPDGRQYTMQPQMTVN